MRTWKKMTSQAERFMHRTCRHVDDRGPYGGVWLVVVDKQGIVTFPRLADGRENRYLTDWGKLCLAEKPSIEMKPWWQG